MEDIRQQVTAKFKKVTGNAKIASQIENSAYGYAMHMANNAVSDSELNGFKRHYANKCASLYSNLDPKSNINNT